MFIKPSEKSSTLLIERIEPITLRVTDNTIRCNHFSEILLIIQYIKRHRNIAWINQFPDSNTIDVPNLFKDDINSFNINPFVNKLYKRLHKNVRVIVGNISVLRPCHKVLLKDLFILEQNPDTKKKEGIKNDTHKYSILS